ncbi:hypothetical protein SAMN05216276_1003273 [Streptosporangium subroseum]|uniref:Uncharacterized protein n=1 Tax=Streptosporangium subroseum TaxID=106412 RepID=A0A239BKI9_9ACTN|nr:hypothetical protein [Streptosporangium subroseum]SNS08132.1 hypothetical protein SAMN05216276_1003273 [Streptosporangium subroseum]
MHRSVRRLLGSAATVAVAASLSLTVADGTSASVTSSAIPQFTMPKVYGTRFQAASHHDFTKGILRSRDDGILRGWVRSYNKGTAEYTPVRWVSGKQEEDGFFAGPEKGDVSGYRSPVSSKAVLYSTTGCKISGTRVTADERGLGTTRCSTQGLTAHLEAGYRAAMITVYRGQIVKIQEISTP